MAATVAHLRTAATVTAIAWPRWLTFAAPAVVYLAVRAAGVGLLAWMSAVHGKPLNLHPWDGDWYLSIAQHGYGGVPDAMRDMYGQHGPYTAMAFFPAYPWLVSLVAALLGGHYVLAGLTVSTVAGVVAAYGVARLARHVTGSQRAALIAVVLFAAAPMSSVYSLVFPEALLCALAAWALVGVVEQKWRLAGVCAATAGLVRPSAVAIVAVVVAVAVWGALRGRGNRTAVGAALLAPTGLIAYYAWVANETGSLTGYFDVQRTGWDLGFDGGANTAAWVLGTLAADTSLFGPLTAWTMATAVILLVVTARRMPWPLWAYACVIVVLTIGTSGVMATKPRNLLPAFVLLIPIAAILARQRVGVAVTLTVGYAVLGLWIGAYSLTVWLYAI